MARAFLLETAEAAAEAARLRRLALGLEPAQPGLELVQVGAAPTVLPLVELSLPLGEELLSRGDRVGVLGELATGAEKGLFRASQLCEPSLDLRQPDAVGVGRDALALLQRALSRVELA